MTTTQGNAELMLVRSQVDRISSELVTLSQHVHRLAEVAFEEWDSAEACRALLRQHGFRIEDVPGLPTAFVARAGHGPRTIALCCEYDAIPGLGHGCGHNVIAAAGVGAGCALARLVDPSAVTVLVVGCPAEEYGGGKALLLDAGVFDGVEAAAMVHPGNHDSADFVSWAFVSLRVAARQPNDAAGAASEARSAVKAGDYGDRSSVTEVVVTEQGAHFDVDLRAHTGGSLRAEWGRFEAEVAGLPVLVEQLEPVYEAFEADHGLLEDYTAHALALGRDVGPARGPFAMTDMGNVSIAVPALHAMIDISGSTDGPHSEPFVDHARSSRADQAVLDAAAALAATLLSHLHDARAHI